jgi:putative ABC transport system permease protein
VRASNPTALVPAIQDAVQRLGPGRPVHDVTTLQALVDDASADTRFALFVLGVFGALALALTAVGVYGAVAYATARRTREIAVRKALGASARSLVALVVRQGLGWMAGGGGAGALGARLLSRSIESLLFQVAATDTLTFIAVALLLAAVALVASAVPAIRAARVDPMLALRSE